jgi:hypothetical protein
MLSGTLFGAKDTTHVGDCLAHVCIESKAGVLEVITCNGFRISNQGTLYNTPDFKTVLHISGMTTVYKALSVQPYDYVMIDPEKGIFEFDGYKILVEVIPLNYINAANYIPHWRESEAWLTINPKSLLCLLPKPAKKPQRVTLRLNPDNQYLGLSIPATLGVVFDIKHEKSLQSEVSVDFNYMYFYQALSTFKLQDKIDLKLFDGYRGIILSDNTSYYWILPMRGVAE